MNRLDLLHYNAINIQFQCQSEHGSTTVEEVCLMWMDQDAGGPPLEEMEATDVTVDGPNRAVAPKLEDRNPQQYQQQQQRF